MRAVICPSRNCFVQAIARTAFITYFSVVYIYMVMCKNSIIH